MYTPYPCSFPYPIADASIEDNTGGYEIEMMKALREVNIDNNQIGWYQSSYLGSYCTVGTIASQFEYQESLPKR